LPKGAEARPLDQTSTLMKATRSLSFRRFSWRHFRPHSFGDRVFLLSLASGCSGILVAAFVVVVASCVGQYIDIRDASWWERLTVLTALGGLVMLIVGLLVGLVVFGAIALESRQWRVGHKWRFTRRLRNVYLLICVTPLFICTLTTLCLMIFSYMRGNPLLIPELFDAAIKIELGTVIFTSCLFVWLLARSSKTKPLPHKSTIGEYRLLPLD